VDLFLSSLSNSGHEYYSLNLSTLEFQLAETKSIPFASFEQKFLQLKECHALCRSAHQEGAKAVLLNPNPVTASNRQGGKQKGKTQQCSSAVIKKIQPAGGNGRNTTAHNGKPILCLNCGKPGHKKVDCPKGKEGNVGTITASAHGSTVAFDTQETHHACMAMA